MVTWNPPSCLAAIGLAALLSITSGCSEAYPEPGRVYEDVETYRDEFRCIDGASPITAQKVGGVTFYFGGERSTIDLVLPEGTSGTFRVTGRVEDSRYEGPNLVGELHTAGSVAQFYSDPDIAAGDG